jgi:3-phenylpropionate/trans-cinnamate dioxygenase ferredoxin reductase subunit
LSKEYLAAKKSLADFTLHESGWYRKHDVALRLNSRMESLDPAARIAELGDGTTVRYDKLLLATGLAPRRPPMPGSDSAGVYYLRRCDDAVALNSVLTEGSSMQTTGCWPG